MGKREVGIGILGLGNVGKGTLDILEVENQRIKSMLLFILHLHNRLLKIQK